MMIMIQKPNPIIYLIEFISVIMIEQLIMIINPNSIRALNIAWIIGRTNLKREIKKWG